MLKAPNYQAFFSVSLLYLKPSMFLFKHQFKRFKKINIKIYITVCFYLNDVTVLKNNAELPHLHYSMFLFKLDKLLKKCHPIIYLHYSMFLFKLNRNTVNCWNTFFIYITVCLYLNLHYFLSPLYFSIRFTLQYVSI